MYTWIEFLAAYLLLLLLFGAVRWVGDRFDRWWIKMFEEDDNK